MLAVVSTIFHEESCRTGWVCRRKGMPKSSKPLYMRNGTGMSRLIRQPKQKAGSGLCFGFWKKNIDKKNHEPKRIGQETPRMKSLWKRRWNEKTAS